MTGRTIAIGDIHGCSAALAAIINAIDPQPNDTIVTLGDYVANCLSSAVETGPNCSLSLA